MGRLALAAVVRLVRAPAMRSGGGRRRRLFGPHCNSAQQWGRQHACGALNTLAGRDPAAEAETVEILQLALAEPGPTPEPALPAPVSKCSSSWPTGRRFKSADRQLFTIRGCIHKGLAAAACRVPGSLEPALRTWLPGKNGQRRLNKEMHHTVLNYVKRLLCYIRARQGSTN